MEQQHYDKEGSGTFDHGNLRKILQDLKIQPYNKIYNEIKYTLDPMECGHFSINDFIEYVTEVSAIEYSFDVSVSLPSALSQKRCKSAKFRIKHFLQRPQCAIYKPLNLQNNLKPTSFNTGSATKYVPPNTGSVVIKVLECYDVSPEEEEHSSPLTDSQVSLISFPLPLFMLIIYTLCE